LEDHAVTELRLLNVTAAEKLPARRSEAVSESPSGNGSATIRLFTIGFAGKSAEQFFGYLQKAGVRLVIDTRLNNVSQLAGFTKRRDLEYFLRVIGGIPYIHDTELAPTDDMLDAYKKKRMSWDEYETRFNTLIEGRAIADRRKPGDFDSACLLCSEPTPEHCHRRLVGEYLRRAWPQIDVTHL
jgi:uncharacterized protein (DUF488 family)